MKILITGGTGFIGRRLVAHLKVAHEVLVLTRQGSRAYDLLGHDIKLLDSLDRLDNLNDVDAVINLAGSPSPTVAGASGASSCCVTAAGC